MVSIHGQKASGGPLDKSYDKYRSRGTEDVSDE